MISANETALTCDFAEVYGVLNRRALPVSLQAALAVGLGANSRIKRHLSGAKAPLDILLLAAAVDRLSLMVWANTKDARRGQNRPKSIFDAIQRENNRDSGVAAFMSGEDFQSEWKRITGAKGDVASGN